MEPSPQLLAVRGRLSERNGEVFIRDQNLSGEFREITHGHFAGMADRFRLWLARHAEPGDLVAVACDRSADCVAALVAGISNGVVVAPVNPRLRGPQLLRVLTMASPAAILVDGLVLHSLATSCQDLTGLRRLPLGLLNWHRLHSFQKQAYEPFFPHLDLVLPEPSTVQSLAADVDGEQSVDAQPTTWDPATPGLCLFTSGSTGSPKGVLISNEDVVARARAEIELFSLSPDEILLGLLPFSFDVGCNQMMTAALSGCSLVILDSWLPADIARTAERFGVTGISCVPGIWRDFLRGGFRFDSSGSHRHLRYITVSGGDLGKDELSRLSHAAGKAGIFKTYGQTEAFRLTCLRPSELQDRPTSVGRAFASAKIGVFRPDTEPAEPFEEGELVLAGLGAMSGYLEAERDDEKLIPNPLRMHPHDPELAVRTGDFGYMDSEGYVFLRGRRDTMIKVNGNRVYPAEVAGILLNLPFVRDAAAVGIRRNGGEGVLVAFVVLAEDTTEPDLQRSMRRLLPPFMVPRLTERRSEIPLTPGGKPDLTLLARQALKALEAMEGRSTRPTAGGMG